MYVKKLDVFVCVYQDSQRRQDGAHRREEGEPAAFAERTHLLVCPVEHCGILPDKQVDPLAG